MGDFVIVEEEKKEEEKREEEEEEEEEEENNEDEDEEFNYDAVLRHSSLPVGSYLILFFYYFYFSRYLKTHSFSPSLSLPFPTEYKCKPGEELFQEWTIENTGKHAWPQGTILRSSGADHLRPPEAPDVTLPMVFFLSFLCFSLSFSFFSFFNFKILEKYKRGEKQF